MGPSGRCLQAPYERAQRNTRVPDAVDVSKLLEKSVAIAKVELRRIAAASGKALINYLYLPRSLLSLNPPPSFSQVSSAPLKVRPAARSKNAKGKTFGAGSQTEEPLQGGEPGSAGS